MTGPHPNPLPAQPGEGTSPADRPPFDAASAVRLARRGVLSARLARFGLLCLAVAGFLLASGDTLPVGLGLLFGTAAGWVALVARTARNQQDVLRAAAWLEAGDYSRLDYALVRCLGRFSVARRPRLAALRDLAFSRHAQGHASDARVLADAALALRPPKADADALSLLIAENALAGNDLVAAHRALSNVAAPLPLSHSLKVLELSTDYCVRIAAWPHVTHDLPAKIELAELLPAESAAAVQAMFALAALRVGQPAWAEWLGRRAGLLAAPDRLVARHPVLTPVFTARS